MRAQRLLPLLLALATGLAACSGSGETGSPAAQTTTSAPAASASDTRQARPSDAPGETPDDGAPASPSAPAPRRATGDLAAAPGTYRYAQQGSLTFGTFTIDDPPEGTLVVEEATGPAGARRQRSVRRYSDSREQEQLTLLTRDAIALEEIVTRVGSGITAREYACRPAEPLVVVELPLRVGARWTSSGACDGFSLSLEGRVLREERRTVGGEAVDTFVLRIVTRSTGDDVEQTATSTLWLSPEHRVVVRAKEATSGTMAGTSFSSQLTARLRSLQPER